jgi:membrane-associated protease RseP (regulator of RpoE activity)
MYAILAIVMLAVAGAVHLGALFAARWGATRALGTKTNQSSLGMTAARSVAGVLGWYLASSFVFAIAAGIGGRVVIDETSMRVQVAEGGPAARAGVRDGDRIVSAGGVPIHTWDELKRIVGSQVEGEPLPLEIDRSGTSLTLTATPEGSPPKLRVAPPYEQQSVSVGSAVAEGLVAPGKIQANTFRGLLRMLAGSEKPELSGPVGIVQETSNSIRVGMATSLRLTATLASYFLLYVVPGTVLYELLTRRRRRNT